MRRFFERAIELHGVPQTITVDKSGANKAATKGPRADSGADIGLRQSKYLDNIVEQDHRAIKRIVRPMLGFKSFRCASILIGRIETMHRIKKGQPVPKTKLRTPHSSSTRWLFDCHGFDQHRNQRFQAVAADPINGLPEHCQRLAHCRVAETILVRTTLAAAISCPSTLIACLRC